MKNKYNLSNSFFEKAKTVIPLGSQTFSKSIIQYPKGVSPLFVDRGKGSKVWDIDGNQYIDLVSGLLPVVLGYQDPDVDKAIKDQLAKGITFSLPTMLETKLAEKLTSLIPCAEMVRFGKNGTDATSAAIRLSRAYTNKEKVIALGYHGWQDWFIGSTSRHKGVPKAVRNLTNRVPYNDINALESAFNKAKNNIAAVIMEPMTFDWPEEGYLEKVKRLCEKKGALLVFDEIITGFRFNLGGAQKLLGVTPHLAAFGKGMGNGMPISAIVGRADIMMEMNEIFYSGTFGGEALSIAASIAVINKMQSEPVIEHLWDFGALLKDGIRKKINQYNLQDLIEIKGANPWTMLKFSDYGSLPSAAIRTQYIIDMLENGVLTLGTHNISYAHNKDDLIKIVNANEKAFKNISTLLSEGTLLQNLKSSIILPVFEVRNK
jgi:glutamate-1-semialdehyde 2,1-aminomutase